MRFSNTLIKIFTPFVNPLVPEEETADDLIAAAIAQKLANDFDSWYVAIGTSGRRLGTNLGNYGRGGKKGWTERDSLRNGAESYQYAFNLIYLNPNEDKIDLRWKVLRRAKDGDGSSPWEYALDYCTVDGVQLTKKASDYIYSQFHAVEAALKESKKVAEQARKEMEINEKKWNLVERLMKMRRTESGALVPIETPEDNAPQGPIAEVVEPFPMCDHTHGWCEICNPEKIAMV